jgi:hypothetical protein
VTDSQVEYIQAFNVALKQLSRYCYITRNSDLQRRANADLEDMLSSVTQEKTQAIAERDEHFANVLLGCEALIRACNAELKMYLLLKEDKPDEAWDELVVAQDGISAAMRADEGFADAAHQLRRLQGAEKLLFPPQQFLSTGWIVKGEVCSICGSDYEDCEHIKGRPYMGQFCTVYLDQLEVDHVSLVDEPASKHCRVTHIGPSGNRTNCLTLIVEQETPKTESNVSVKSEGQIYQGVLATAPVTDKG